MGEYPALSEQDIKTITEQLARLNMMLSRKQVTVTVEHLAAMTR